MTEGFGLAMSGSACGAAVTLIGRVSSEGYAGKKLHQGTPNSYKTQPPAATLAATARFAWQTGPSVTNGLRLKPALQARVDYEHRTHRLERPRSRQDGCLVRRAPGFA